MGLTESSDDDGVGRYSSADQHVAYGGGTQLGKALGGCVATFAIRVAVDFQMEARVRSHNRCDLAQLIERAGAERRRRPE